MKPNRATSADLLARTVQIMGTKAGDPVTPWPLPIWIAGITGCPAFAGMTGRDCVGSIRALNDLVAATLRPAYWSITLNFLLSDSQHLAMPRGGSKPGERRGGRQKGTPNKLSIGRMKARLAVSAPEFDPYDQLEIIAKTFLERARAEQHRDKPNMRVVDDLLDKAARVLRDVLRYKRARLTAMKVSGDKDAPLFDLSALSDSELAFLRRTILKAQQVHEGE